MMKRILALTLVSTLCIAYQEHPTVIVSIQKCGTHLLGGVIDLLTNKKIYWPGFIRGKELDEALTTLRDNRFMMIHVPYRSEIIEIFEKHHATLFFVYRDPRDQVVSDAYFRLHWQAPDGTRVTNHAQLVTELLSNFVAPWYADSTTKRGVAACFESLMPWAQHPGICVIRFEDLIGEQGGGSAKVQKETIARIAEHLGIAYTEETIAYVVEHLFGNSMTFREGKIGSWKRHFSDHDKNIAKQTIGQLLIDLGYENGMDW
jgi:hypothetical protein